MGMDELEASVLKETQRLGKLQASDGEREEVVYNDGGEVKYRTIKTDNEKEIIAQRAKIMEMQKQAEQQRAYKNSNLEQKEEERYQEERNKERQQKELREKEKIEENYRKITFKRVKETHKSQSSFTRFINFINGRSPKWSNVKKYSQEELDFLMKMSKGNTENQKYVNDQKRSRNSGDLSEVQIEKEIAEKNMIAFNLALGDSDVLKERMTYEEGRGK